MILTSSGSTGWSSAGWSRTRAANYTIASSGLAALGIDTPQCQPWVNVAALSAPNAKDVLRWQQYPNEMPPSERPRLSSLWAQKARPTARLNWTSPFKDWAIMSG